MTQCSEAKCVPANSSQSAGLIEFSDEASHVFSGPMNGALHLIILQHGATHCFTYYLFLWISELSIEFFSMPGCVSRTKGKGSMCNASNNTWDALSSLHVTVKYVPNISLPVALVLKHKWPYHVLSSSCKYKVYHSRYIYMYIQNLLPVNTD